MIKLVAFDWNGTLLADAQLAADADHHALSPYTKKPVTLKQMRDNFTIPVIDYLKAIGIKKNKYLNHHEKINSAFNEYYESGVDKCRTRAGVRQSLKFLSNQNIGAIIYSNHIIPYIEKQLRRLKINRHFQAVLARPEGDFSHMHSRGKAQKLEDYVKFHKIKPHEVISVGDSEEEIEIGKHRGYHTIAITGGV